MVTGGYPDCETVELVGTDGKRICTLPKLPECRTSHTQNGLVVCAGWCDGETCEEYSRKKYVMKSCVTFKEEDGEWHQTHTLKHSRRMHESWASPKGVMLLGTTAYSTYSEILKSTEILTNNGDTKPGFKLRHRIYKYKTLKR